MPEDALRVTHPRVRQADLAAGERDRDLARMQVRREDEIEGRTEKVKGLVLRTEFLKKA